MTIAKNIRIFLSEKLKEVDRKNFATNSGIIYDTLNKIIREENLIPNLSTLLDIAKSFNCTIDEVIGRKANYKKSQNYKFKDISLEEALLNLKSFVNAKVAEKQLEDKKFTYQKLSKAIGFSSSTIAAFIKGTHKSLSTAVIVALADYFKVLSIDEMIGRVSTSLQESQTLEESEPKTE